jgi:hypothetical protein
MLLVNMIFVKENGKKKLVSVYSKTHQGERLVHASEGRHMDGIIGTKDEDFFFRVKYCVGDTINSPSYEPIDLFYYSPEEAEEHLCIKISEKTKALFRERNLN